jgi:hypothetical protein
VDDVDDLISSLSLGNEQGSVHPHAAHIEHPVFGKGRIIKELNNGRYLIDFDQKGEKMIDTSIVDIRFI